jgi:hypothetical protein
VATLAELRYVLYETKGELTIVREPGGTEPDPDLVRAGLRDAAAYPSDPGRWSTLARRRPTSSTPTRHRSRLGRGRREGAHAPPLRQLPPPQWIDQHDAAAPPKVGPQSLPEELGNSVRRCSTPA